MMLKAPRFIGAAGAWFGWAFCRADIVNNLLVYLVQSSHGTVYINS